MGLVLTVFNIYKMLNPPGHFMALPQSAHASWMAVAQAGDICIISVSFLTFTVLNSRRLRGFAVHYFDSMASFWSLSPCE
jgi:hypothetical protein